MRKLVIVWVARERRNLHKVAIVSSVLFWTIINDQDLCEVIAAALEFLERFGIAPGVGLKVSGGRAAIARPDKL